MAKKKGCGCISSVVSLVVVVVFTGGVLFAISYFMRSATTYQEAMERARANPAVTAVTGEPIEDPYFFWGTIQSGGGASQANFTLNISGPKGGGTVDVVASELGGEWTYHTLTFESDEGKRVNLLTNR